MPRHITLRREVSEVKKYQDHGMYAGIEESREFLEVVEDSIVHDTEKGKVFVREDSRILKPVDFKLVYEAILPDYTIDIKGPLEFVIIKIRQIKEKLENINTYRGYIHTDDIFSQDYPFVNEIAAKIMSRKEWLELDPLNKIKVYN